jgi:hypothetical protein
MEAFEAQSGEYTLSTDPQKLDLSAIHRYLSEESYWAKNIPFDRVAKAASHSLNFGIYHKGQQVGYARIVSDFATVVYLGDVFVLEEHRGRGLSK